LKLPPFNLYQKLRPIFFLGDPEKMHTRTLSFIEKLSNSPKFFKFLDSQFNEEFKILQTNIFEKSLNNPIGIAAGFDKDGKIFKSLFKIGFGFVEIGTVTPLPQKGNIKPRIFRLVKDEAIVNWLGFNSLGALAMYKNLKNVKNRIELSKSNEKSFNSSLGILGINIGKNKLTSFEKASEDYVTTLEKLYPYADYFTLNLSSPNTDKLVNLQKGNALENILEKVCNCRDKLDQKNSLKTPLLLKISPDLNNYELNESILIIKKFSIQGIIATNSTIDFSGLKERIPLRRGGVSGKPLKKKSTRIIRKLFKELGNNLIIIGVGGISSGADAYEKIKAGASAVQIYTSLVYEGPALVKKVKKELATLLEKDGYSKVSEAVGRDN